MNEDMLVKLIVLSPFAGALLLYLLRRVLPPVVAGALGSLAVLLPFGAACMVFLASGESIPKDHTVTLLSWISAGGFDVDFAFRVDALSLTWILFITGIGFLIHVYSIGYMKGDPGFTRFFTYLNLFVGSMLALVLGDSLVLMFLGWEGVGLCSYLLIGFWFEDMENAKAGQKAFVVNRIGDLGFLLAMMLIFREFGTLTIAEVTGRVSELATAGTLATGDGTITAIALLLFVGAVGKSAQFPLYVWLPDAMAGPTPVSALIHAATMVTAGIYMVARLSVFFALSPAASLTVAAIGCFTAFFSATIALRQRDIKKVLAYSTCSQLGFMFMALGVGAYKAAVFHVITHAFFKALLFLGAGSVIHAMSGEQDAMKMGRLKPHLKQTHATFLVGCLALAGIFPFAGFFSKDQILASALLGGGGLFWFGVLGVITAAMTAFYTFRLYTLVFKSNERLDEHAKAHLHESPPTMVLPLWVLAVLSVVGGALSLPHFDSLGAYLEPIFAPAYALAGAPEPHGLGLEIGLMLMSLVIAVGSAWFATMKYADGPGREATPARVGMPYAVENKWFVDEIYALFVVGPMRAISYLTGFLDRVLVDGLVNGVARVCDGVGSSVRSAQNGTVHTYALLFLAGAVVLAISLL